jgi:predicted PP-loop superfamily ATPase
MVTLLLKTLKWLQFTIKIPLRQLGLKVISEALKLNMDKDDLIKLISNIRVQIGHKRAKVEIYDSFFNPETKVLNIITTDRPGKSIIIGKGGWVVGRLKEELGVQSVHVESRSDLMTRRYYMELASTRLEEIKNNYESGPLIALENLSRFLNKRIKKPYELFSLLDGIKKDDDNTLDFKSVVALSGGVDSSASLILAKYLGFNPLAVTVDPGSIILPGFFQKNVEKLSEKLQVEHEYLKLDFKEVVDGALDGRFHPCGRCSKLIENTISNHARDNRNPFMFYGDLLSTGSHSLVEGGEVLRINLPALLSATKGEVKHIASEWGIKSQSGYGCPLLKEVTKKHPSMSRYSIQRVLRETRAGVLEPGEALDMVMRFQM